jgi:hypothetical protein
MFIISQSVLHKSKLCNFESISTYSIASGMVVYAGIYLYFLFYNNEYLSLFNKFIIYIVGIDLLLSTFYYFNSSKTHSYQTHQDILNNENISLFDENNNVQEDFSNHTDTDSDTETDSELESEYEIEDNQDEDTQVEDTQVEETQAQIEATQVEATQVEGTQVEATQVEATQVEGTQVEGTQAEEHPVEGTKDLEMETLSEPLKKRRGRKPNSLKVNLNNN